MIQKQKLIASVSKKAKISIAKATAAYETILKESPSWKKQALKTVSATTEVAVAVPGKMKIKEVKVSKQKAVKTTNKVEKIKTVQVIKEVPVEVIKEVIKKVEVKVEVPVEVIKEVEIVKEVEVIKEVPVVVEKIKIKEVKVEKKVLVEVIKEITLIKEVVDEKEVNKWKAKSTSLEKAMAASTKQMADLKKSNDKKTLDLKKAYDKKIQDLNKKLAAKPKEVIKEIEVIKEVPVEIIKEVEVVKSIDFSTLEAMMKNLGTVEVSKTVIGETRTARESKVVERREIKEGTARTKVTGKSTTTTKKKSSSAKPKAKKVTAKKTAAKKPVAKKPVVKKTTATKAPVKKAAAKKDDLTKIEGIGPKISQLLIAGKITSFSALSKAKTNTLKAILDKAGPRFQMHNPGSWAQQAGLAASGKWKELEKLQDKLNGGK